VEARRSENVGKVIDLSEHLKPLEQRTATITLPQELLWDMEPCPEGCDPLVSAIKFADIWRQRLQRRFPDIAVTVKVMPGRGFGSAALDFGANLSTRMTAKITKEQYAIAVDLQKVEHRKTWLVHKGSPEWIKIVKTVRPQESLKQEALGKVY